jgi:hypothetical protein
MNLAENLPLIWADPSQIEQVIMAGGVAHIQLDTSGRMSSVNAI